MERFTLHLVLFLAMIIGLSMSTDKRGRSKLSSKHHVLRMQGKKLDPISGKVRTIGKRSGTFSTTFSEYPFEKNYKFDLQYCDHLYFPLTKF